MIKTIPREHDNPIPICYPVTGKMVLERIVKMDGISNLFLGLGLLSVGWGIVSMVVITNFVAERGTKINYFLYRLYVIKYVNRYKQITEAENGEPGPWFYSFIVSMNFALMSSIVGLLFKSL